MSGNIADDDHSRLPFAPSTQFRFSPRSHNANTIKWQTWGQHAFEEAARLDKPIFLLITSSWCQWCHIMDETTLSDPTIISILNRDYVPIRVDSDLRPDVNQRYNQNGWPSVVLLSSEGEILWGGVYVPPQQMLYYLGHIRRYYGEHRQEIAEQVRELQDRRFTQKLTQTLPTTGVRALLQEERTALVDLPIEAGVVLRDLYDEEYGGFKIHPHLKFPHPEALELLLMLSEQYKQDDALEMVCYSLEQMVDGGLWDQEEGGFFRYSASSDWSMAHTEKMLEENAALLRLILLTVQASQCQRWYDLAKRLVTYVNATLWLPGVGAFAGSQSADEEYYEPGLYSRASKQRPLVDKTIYTSWNARMIAAYLLAGKVLNTASLQALALKGLDWLCEHMVHKGGSMYHFMLNGQAELPGQLADQVWMTRALLDAYDLVGRKSYLETAIALMHFACQELLDDQSGLFYDYPEDAQAEGRLVVREQPLIENALAAESLLRMAVYSKRSSMRHTGLRMLSGCLGKYVRTGIQGATYACVVAEAVKNQWL
ncbi:MAG: thioredoxin domain-containing protein [Ktedonobacteraceae bacterium]